MEKVIDIPGTEQSIGGLALGVVAQAKAAREAKMGNAVEIQTPSQIDAAEQPRAVMTPMEMVSRALEMGVSAEILKQMMDLRDREDAKQARKAFDSAIAAAKAEIPPIVRNATGHNSKRYADFSAIASVVDPILSRHGLSYRFRAAQTDRISVTCVLSHREGHSEETTLSGAPDTSGNKNPIQAIGSTCSYLQRYSLNAALGLSSASDDDGKAAGVVETKIITEAQASVILDLIEQGKVDTAKFCERWEVDAVASVPMAKFNEVVMSLRQRIAHLTQQKAGSAA